MRQKLKFFLLTIAAIFINSQTQGQCDVIVNSSSQTVCAGESITLSASGGCNLLSNTSIPPSGGSWEGSWSSTHANPVFTNPCGPGISDAHFWIGTTSSNIRTVLTTSLDVSSGNCFIKWWMRYGRAQTSGDCNSPDQSDEGVHLQWSTDGATWTDFPGINQKPVGNTTAGAPFNTTIPGTGGYWSPDSSQATQQSSELYYWNKYENPIPASAVSSNTQFRWAQLNNSGQGQDAWGFDSVTVTCPAPNQNVSWSHGPSVLNPPAVKLPSKGNKPYDTCFHVTVSNTNYSATDTVCVTVTPKPNATIDYQWIESDELIYTDVSTPGAPSYALTGRQWSFGAGASPQTSQDSSVQVTYSSPGNYEAELIVQNDHSCSDTSTLIANITSIDANETETGIKIYPNPSRGIINIEIPDSIDHNPGISVYDFRGKLIRNVPDTDKKIKKIDLSEVKSGNYLFVIENKNFIVTRKIMIE
ncbi:MAG: T9SS type A sorting domain-containing protein [Bacteroidales bacterium]